MKKKIKVSTLLKFLKMLIILFIIAVIYLAFRDGRLFNMSKDINTNETFNDNIEQPDYIENELDDISKIIIEDDKVYLNGFIVNEILEVPIKLSEINDNRKVILKSKKAKLIVYNKLIEVLEDNNYVIIEEN